MKLDVAFLFSLSISKEQRSTKEGKQRLKIKGHNILAASTRVFTSGIFIPASAIPNEIMANKKRYISNVDCYIF